MIKSIKSIVAITIDDSIESEKFSTQFAKVDQNKGHRTYKFLPVHNSAKNR